MMLEIPEPILAYVKMRLTNAGSRMDETRLSRLAQEALILYACETDGESCDAWDAAYKRKQLLGEATE